MFGYLLPDKSELKVKEFAQFRAAYCGVCRAIKLGYGELPRFAVSYDAAVLAVLLVGCEGHEPVAKKRVCALNPVKGKPVYEGHEAFAYAAAVSVMLAWGRVKDAWADEHNLLALPAMAALSRANRRACARYPVVADQIGQSLKDLDALERARCNEIDRTADAMGNLMSAVMTSGPVIDPAAKVLLRSVGYHLGRWIYLIDALDDLKKDRKSGAYNPILAMGGSDENVELARKTCLYAASQAAAVFDLMEFQWGRPVIENVMYSGMPRIYHRVTDKESTGNDRSVEGAGHQEQLKP